MLYNKYAIKNIEDLVGQESTVKAIKKYRDTNKFPHTLFFSGTTGTGKTTLEKIVSKILLCEHKDENGNPCHQCKQCIAIDNGENTLNYEEHNASELKIEEVKDIINRAESRIMSSNPIRVFVIDELQEMKKAPAALKALLKILEKDIPNVFFILGAMETVDLPDAVKDRTMQFNLKLADTNIIAEYLYKIALAENIQIDEAKAKVLIAIAENSNHSLRRSLKYLQKCIDCDIWEEKALLEDLEIVTEDTLISIINQILTGEVNVLNNKISSNVVDRIRDTLINLYKHIEGADTNFYYKNQFKKITKVDTIIIKNALEGLSLFYQYPFLTQNIIDYELLKIILSNRGLCQKNVQQESELQLENTNTQRRRKVQK